MRGQGKAPGPVFCSPWGLGAGDYTLTFSDGSKVVHYRINKTEEGVNIGPSRSFPTIQILVQHYRERSDGIACRLSQTVPRAHSKVMVTSRDDAKRWEIKRSEIEVGRMLGSGNFGDVHEGVYKKQRIAIKTVKEGMMDPAEFLLEAHVMKRLVHPNLVRLVGVCTERMPMFIITEFLPNGDLLSYMRKPSARACFLFVCFICNQIELLTFFCSYFRR